MKFLCMEIYITLHYITDSFCKDVLKYYSLGYEFIFYNYFTSLSVYFIVYNV
jgi:hypothetical protein